jgi:uncharacterized glyoxalase superfamily protein PhnB
MRSWVKLIAMTMHLPKAVPEIPVSHVEKAAEYYVNKLGFTMGWGDDAGGIGGIFQGDCRLFLTNAAFREHYGNGDRVVVWINLESRAAVDELYQRWREAGATILEEPEDKPWKLREFRVADLDGNQIRVFYDFHWEEPEEKAGA